MNDEIVLRYRLEVNRILYEEDIIDLEIYRKMERYLIDKLGGKLLI